MSHRSVPALTRAFARAGLTALSEQPECTLPMFADNGLLHAGYRCHIPNRTETWIRFADLAGARICPLCEPRAADGYGVSPALRRVLDLLDAVEQARSVIRFAEDPSKSAVAGKTKTLRSRLTAREQSVARVAAGARGDLAAACERVTGLLQYARHALDAAAADPGLREKVLDRVRAELVPDSLVARVRLDESPVLVGIYPHTFTGKKVQEVLDAFTAGGPGGTQVVLHCPRYVVDYVNRFYAAGSSWSQVVLSVPAGDVTVELAAAAAAAWTPAADSETADLAAALRSVRAPAARP